MAKGPGLHRKDGIFEAGRGGEDEGGEDYHIAEVLHRVNDGTHDRFEAGNHSHGLERPKYAKRSQGRK